jgi:hypothetical protein
LNKLLKADDYELFPAKKNGELKADYGCNKLIYININH